MRSLKPGEVLFEVELAPTGQARVALFSEGTEDPNPIHVDEEFARRAGFATVLQQGPMTTSQFARLLEEAAGRDRLVSLDVTFTTPVFPEDALVLKAEIVEVGHVVRCQLAARKKDGTQTAKGIAELKAE